MSTRRVESTARWRDKQVVPDNYENIAELVKTARAARRCIVEFEWVFTRDDLIYLRRAAFEWGSATVGCYKCFDARVLAAINSALKEENSVFSLKEPRNGRWAEFEVECVPEGALYRLRGHAPFDVVFGYVDACMRPDAAVLCGPTVQKIIVGSFAALGWDPHSFPDKRLQLVRNVLYGFPLDHATEEGLVPDDPPLEIDVHFRGPFSALDGAECPCLFGHDLARRAGVYLWTIKVGGRECPWYVGQTRRGFGQRIAEHVRSMLCGEYTIYDVPALMRGDYLQVEGAPVGEWPQTLSTFLRDYDKLAPHIIDLIRRVRLHLAPLTGDRHIYDRVEGTIGRYYKAHLDEQLRKFFVPGLKVPAAIPGDRRMRLALSSDTPIAGLPSVIHEPALGMLA